MCCRCGAAFGGKETWAKQMIAAHECVHVQAQRMAAALLAVLDLCEEACPGDRSINIPFHYLSDAEKVAIRVVRSIEREMGGKG